MRRVIVPALLLVLTIIATGCSQSSAPPDSSAPKAGSAAPAAKPSPSANDPAIKPPTRNQN